MKKLAIYLVFGSFVPYLFIFVLPFLPISNSLKTSFVPVLIILGEGMFWIGGLIVGKEVIKHYRGYINPMNWIKKRKVK